MTLTSNSLTSNDSETNHSASSVKTTKIALSEFKKHLQNVVSTAQSQCSTDFPTFLKSAQCVCSAEIQALCESNRIGKNNAGQNNNNGVIISSEAGSEAQMLNERIQGLRDTGANRDHKASTTAVKTKIK